MKHFAIIATLLFPLFTTPARALDFTWDGQFNDVWNTTVPSLPSQFTNWTPDFSISNPIPNSNDTVSFVNPSANTNVDLNGSRSVLSVTFGGNDDYTLSNFGVSTDTLTLVDGDVTATGTATHIFNVSVELDSDGTWSINSPVLEVSRLISTNNLFRKTGSGTLLMTGGDEFEFSSIRTMLVKNGLVLVDGGNIQLTDANFGTTRGPLKLEGGDLTLRNGAVVQATKEFPATVIENGTLTVSGAGTSLHTKTELMMAFANTATSSLVLEDGGMLDHNDEMFVGWNGDADVTVQTGATASVTGKMSIGSRGASSSSVLVTGSNSLLSAGSLGLGGQNSSYNGGTGALTVNDGGAVDVNGLTKLWTSFSSITINGGTYETGRLTNHTGVTATVSISDPSGGTALTVGTNDGNSTFDGIIEDAAGGAGSLKKVGTGILTLTGANTYSGGTLIDGGTLLANNTSGSATGSGPMQVTSGATLGGTGSAAGTVTVNSGGTVAPGASVGTLTVEDVVFESGSTFDVELAGSGGVAGVDFDQLAVNNGATLGGTLNVSLVNPFTLSPGLSFEILDVGGSLSGTFDDLAEGGLVGNYSGTNLLISYIGGDGNDVTLFSALPGDFDLDNDVDGFDFLMWQRGESPDPLSASDLSDWETNYGMTAPLAAASAAVPEPSALVLLLTCGLVALGRTRRV